MSAPLAIVLVDDPVLPDPAPLCGRPAGDWLLDTVEALGPAVLIASGSSAALAEGRDGLKDALHATQRCPVALVLSSSTPLLRPHTLRRLLDSLDSFDADPAALGPGAAPAGTVTAGTATVGTATVGTATVVELVAHRPWWAEDARTGRPAVVAAVARAGISTEALDHLATLALAAPDPVRQPPAGWAPVRTGELGGVEALWLRDDAERVAAENALFTFIAAGWSERGVIIEDPATTRIDATVHIAEGARIRSHTELIGNSSIGRGSRVGPVTTVEDSTVGEGCVIRYSLCQHVEIGDDANVGPFTWLRSGSKLGARCRAGAYVEVADSVVGDGTVIPHLAGLFSADVGRDCNIASMAGSLSYNGGKKRRTRIGDEVSIGSGSLLIAPVSIGDRAETAAGSVISEDVPSDALAMSRTPQRNIAGWAAVRQRNASAG